MEKFAPFPAVTPSDLISAKEPPPKEGLEALAHKYEAVLLAMESMRPELVAELPSRIETAASLFPRKDASEKQSQCGASYLRKKNPKPRPDGRYQVKRMVDGKAKFFYGATYDEAEASARAAGQPGNTIPCAVL